MVGATRIRQSGEMEWSIDGLNPIRWIVPRGAGAARPDGAEKVYSSRSYVRPSPSKVGEPVVPITSALTKAREILYSPPPEIPVPNW